VQTIARSVTVTAALVLFVATGLGAYAAHGLEAILATDSLETFRTGVAYQFYHGLGLLGTAMLIDRFPSQRSFRIAAGAFALGVMFFCGSLYLLAFGFPRWLGMVAPVGGIAFMVGWAAVFVGAFRSHKA